MRLTISTILPTLILSTLFLPGTALAATVFIDPPTMSVTEPTDIIISVSVSDVQDLYGFQFDLTYNPGVLKFQNISEGAFLGSDGSSTFWFPPNSSTPGFLDNTISTRLGMVGGLDGSGILATLVFSPLSNGTSPIELTGTVLSDYPDSRQIPADISNGMVSVSLSYHRADTNHDGCIEMQELLAFIDRWKISSQDVAMPELMDAIRLWRGGYGCS
jgi:hypothetical protein